MRIVLSEVSNDAGGRRLGALVIVRHCLFLFSLYVGSFPLSISIGRGYRNALSILPASRELFSAWIGVLRGNAI